MISYSKEDQREYYAERSAYLCILAGIEPRLITPETARDVKAGLALTLTGTALRKARAEVANIILFAGTIGFEDKDA